jgi:hypothetical protein
MGGGEEEREVEDELKMVLESVVVWSFSSINYDDSKDIGQRGLGEFKRKFDPETRQQLADAIDSMHPLLRNMVATQLGGGGGQQVSQGGCAGRGHGQGRGRGVGQGGKGSDAQSRLQEQERKEQERRKAAQEAAQKLVEEIQARADKLHTMILHGEPGAPPLPPPVKGVAFHIEIFRKLVEHLREVCKDVPAGGGEGVPIEERLFESSLPSERLAFLGDAAVLRLLWWEKRQCRRKGRNAAGEVVHNNRYAYMQELRSNPTDPLLVKHKDLRKEYIKPGLTALAKEWEKVMKHGLTGELRRENETPWEREILDASDHTSILCEGTFGTMSARRIASGRAMSYARESAQVNAAMSNPWKVEREMMAEERVVLNMLAHKRPVVRKLAAWGVATKTAVASSTMRRTLRAQEKECDDAAQEYADAMVLWLCDACSVEEIKQHFGDLKFAGPQAKFLQEQLRILTVGWGYKDLALVRHRNNSDACKVCGSCEPDKLKHQLQHLLTVRRRVEDRGGKPSVAPPPKIYLAVLPPALCSTPVDPDTNSIFKYKAEVEARAKKKVDTGRTKARIVRLEDLENEPVPEFNDELVGHEVQYACKVLPAAGAKWVQKLYTGVILSASQHTLVPSAPALKAAKKGKKGKKGKGRATGKAEPPMKYLPSARVKWHTHSENGSVESIFLDPELFNKPKRDGGWYIDMEEEVYEGGGVLDELEEKAIQAEYCCFKKEL